MRAHRNPLHEIPILEFRGREIWANWLAKHHRTAVGVWLRLAKKGSGKPSVTHSDALEVALCYGWIDGQGRREGDSTWLLKFGPRTKRSIWSKLNRQRVVALIRSGQMKPAGLKEIERAKRDGRWDAAYDSPSRAKVPSDFQRALNSNLRAKAFFSTLDSRNRYAILFRMQTAKKPETRAKRMQLFIKMLEKHERVYP